MSAAGATSRQSNQPEWLLLSGPKWAECDRWDTERPFSGRVKGQGPSHGSQMAQVTLVEERRSAGSTPPEGGGVRGSVNVRPSEHVQTGSCAAPSQHFCHRRRCRSNLLVTAGSPQTCSPRPAAERRRSASAPGQGPEHQAHGGPFSSGVGTWTRRNRRGRLLQTLFSPQLDTVT